MTMTVALMIASKPRAMCSMTVRRPDTLALMHAAFHYFVHSEIISELMWQSGQNSKHSREGGCLPFKDTYCSTYLQHNDLIKHWHSLIDHKIW